MADIRISLFPYSIDSPSQVIDPGVSFTLSSKTSKGGVGRLGHGDISQVILTVAVVPPQNLATPNSGFVA